MNNAIEFLKDTVIMCIMLVAVSIFFYMNSVINNNMQVAKEKLIDGNVVYQNNNVKEDVGILHYSKHFENIDTQVSGADVLIKLNGTVDTGITIDGTIIDIKDVDTDISTSDYTSIVDGGNYEYDVDYSKITVNPSSMYNISYKYDMQGNIIQTNYTQA